jgi:hypothetical protein
MAERLQLVTASSVTFREGGQAVSSGLLVIPVYGRKASSKFGNGHLIEVSGMRLTSLGHVATTVGLTAAKRLARSVDVDLVWETGSPPTVHFVDTARIPTCKGPKLSDTGTMTLNNMWPAWTSVGRTGWMEGGPLEILCPVCAEPLTWFDWIHPEAPPMRNTAYVQCPKHGCVNKALGSGLQDLITARRILDSRSWAARGTVSRRRVYVFDLDGVETRAVYVGQTTKTIKARYCEHVCGDSPVQVIRRGARPAGLRPDLAPRQLPALTTEAVALAAERWTAARLEFLGHKVYGDGRR